MEQMTTSGEPNRDAKEELWQERFDSEVTAG